MRPPAPASASGAGPTKPVLNNAIAPTIAAAAATKHATAHNRRATDGRRGGCGDSLESDSALALACGALAGSCLARCCLLRGALACGALAVVFLAVRFAAVFLRVV